MSRLQAIVYKLGSGISRAVLRFPLTVLCLAIGASLICYLISLKQLPPPLWVEKSIFTLIVGALAGMVAQFATERFRKSNRMLLYVLAILLTAGYFLILYPAPEIRDEVVVRSLVTMFALFCAVLYLPSVGKATDFNRVALVHFKSFLTAALYSGVLAAGLSAILVSIDLLLFSIQEESYAYMMTLVWVLFAPIYYLSLLPRFHESHQKDSYPRVLEILVSYIAVPLFAAYTLVLLSYFVKILISLNWPSGQLGPMALAYSAVGILLFILCTLSENRFAHWFRVLFPKVLIPVVIMQMVAVWIRLDAYGITTPRYYIALFAVYSLVSGIILSVWPNGKTGIVVLLSAVFAIVSVLPPVDAFTISRNSQIQILERDLAQEGMLSNGVLVPKSDLSQNVKAELTNRVEYLSRSGSLSYIGWIPKDFAIYDDFETVFGFPPTYSAQVGPGPDQRFFHATLDTDQPLPITGYDMAFQATAGRTEAQTTTQGFKIDGVSYQLKLENLTLKDVRISVTDGAGRELVGTDGLYDFVQPLREKMTGPKDAVPLDDMSFDVEQNGYRLKIVFLWIDLVEESNGETSVSYSLNVLFDQP